MQEIMEAFVLPEFFVAGLAFDDAARTLMKRGYGVNFAYQATISSQRRLHIYGSSSEYGWALCYFSLSK
jgi:hypothetical protein